MSVSYKVPKAGKGQETHVDHLLVDETDNLIERLLMEGMNVFPILVDDTGCSHSTRGLDLEFPEIALVAFANLVGRHVIHDTSVSHDGRLVVEVVV
jgi:hypothetical protein